MKWGVSMGMEHRKWYGKCVENLFLERKHSWECKQVIKLSSGMEERPKEDIIRDTKTWFRAFLNGTVDSLAADLVVEASSIAIASEAMAAIENQDAAACNNILNHILLADNPEEGFLEKMTILFVALEEIA